MGYPTPLQSPSTPHHSNDLFPSVHTPVSSAHTPLSSAHTPLSSEASPHPVQRTESNGSSSTVQVSRSDSFGGNVRDKAKHDLTEALVLALQRLTEAQRIERTLNAEDCGRLARIIERELFKFHGEQVNKEYKSKFRSIMFNLKDAKNSHLPTKLLTGALSPAAFVRMPAAEMAADDVKEKVKEIEAKSFAQSVLKEGHEKIVKMTYKGLVEVEQESNQGSIEGDILHRGSSSASEESSPLPPILKPIVSRPPPVSESPRMLPQLSTPTSLGDSPRFSLGSPVSHDTNTNNNTSHSHTPSLSTSFLSSPKAFPSHEETSALPPGAGTGIGVKATPPSVEYSPSHVFSDPHHPTPTSPSSHNLPPLPRQDSASPIPAISIPSSPTVEVDMSLSASTEGTPVAQHMTNALVDQEDSMAHHRHKVVNEPAWEGWLLAPIVKYGGTPLQNVRVAVYNVAGPDSWKEHMDDINGKEHGSFLKEPRDCLKVMGELDLQKVLSFLSILEGSNTRFKSVVFLEPHPGRAGSQKWCPEISGPDWNEEENEKRYEALCEHYKTGRKGVGVIDYQHKEQIVNPDGSLSSAYRGILCYLISGDAAGEVVSRAVLENDRVNGSELLHTKLDSIMGACGNRLLGVMIAGRESPKNSSGPTVWK